MRSDTQELIKSADIQEIADKGMRVYRKIKSRYLRNRGKFLAIEVESEKVFLGDTSAEALALAKERFPDKVFYVVKIGFDTAETIAHYLIDSVIKDAKRKIRR